MGGFFVVAASSLDATLLAAAPRLDVAANRRDELS
jgi:hypothetical protein